MRKELGPPVVLPPDPDQLVKNNLPVFHGPLQQLRDILIDKRNVVQNLIARDAGKHGLNRQWDDLIPRQGLTLLFRALQSLHQPPQAPLIWLQDFPWLYHIQNQVIHAEELVSAAVPLLHALTASPVPVHAGDTNIHLLFPAQIGKRLIEERSGLAPAPHEIGNLRLGLGPLPAFHALPILTSHSTTENAVVPIRGAWGEESRELHGVAHSGWFGLV